MLILPDWAGWTLLAVTAITFLIQIYYFIFEFATTGFSKDSTSAIKPVQPVSVIICARNELKNLKSFLPFILEQDYPKYQVIVVNDCSWDESGKYLEEMEDAFPQLKVITLKEQEKYRHGKKFALTLGIKGAAYEHLLFTDADCKPAGTDWITRMMEKFEPGKEIVIGYGPYENMPGILNKWIRFDTAQNAMFYLGRAIKGKAYMGVGRNLAYTKSLFFRNKGFAGHYHLMSGDDDLFINETATPVNTAVQLNPGSFTYSKPKTSFNTWFWQKKRHLTTGPFYKSRDKQVSSLYFISLFLFWLSVIVSLVLKLNWELTVSMLSTRLAIQMLIYWKGFRKLAENDLLIFTPLFDLFTAILYPALAVSNLMIKTKSWK